MKTKIKSLVLFSLCALCSFAAVPLRAQSEATTNLPPAVATTNTSVLPGGALTLGSDLLKFLTDAEPYYGHGLRAGAYALYNAKHFGGLVDVQYPLTDGGNISAGGGVAYLNGQFYSVALTVNMGTTWKLPLIGSVYTSLETGPYINAHDHTPGVQSFACLTKDIRFGTDPDATHCFLTGGVGNLSTSPGAAYVFGFSIKPAHW